MTLLPVDVASPAPVGEARCRCGRALTDPASVARGEGPVCWAKSHARAVRRRAVMAAPPTLARAEPTAPGGQLELDLTGDEAGA